MLKAPFIVAASLTFAAAQIPNAYTIETVAGVAQIDEGGYAASAFLDSPQGVAMDRAGNIYFADTKLNLIRRITADGRISTIAGNGEDAPPRDGLAVEVPVARPHGLAFDGEGNLYVAQGWALRKIDRNGQISTVWTPKYAYQLSAVAVDSDGSVFVAVEYGCYVVKVMPDRTSTVVAGTETCGSASGDGGVATSARMSIISSVALDQGGNLYIAEGYSRVRKVTRAGIISSIALPPRTYVVGVTVDTAGNLVLADPTQGVAILKAGGGLSWLVKLPSVFDNWRIQTGRPDRTINILATPQGGVLLPDPYTHGIYNINSGGAFRIAGAPRFSGDGGRARSAVLDNPLAVAADASGGVLVADYANRRIRRISADGDISTVAGNGRDPSGAPQSGPPVDLGIGAPVAIGASARSDHWAFAANRGFGVWRVVEGMASAQPGFASVGNLAAVSRGIAITTDGELVYSDLQGCRVMAVDKSGKARAIAGTGSCGYSGDAGPSEKAQLNWPRGLALDSKGRLYIADTGNYRVRMVDDKGIIHTVAGGGPNDNWASADLATTARLYYPVTSVAVDSRGNLFFADGGYVRLVDPEGRIWAVAGNDWRNYTPQRVDAWTAPVVSPNSVTVDSADRVWIAETDVHRIRVLTTDRARSIVRVYNVRTLNSRVGTPSCGYPFTDCVQSRFPVGRQRLGLYFEWEVVPAGKHSWRRRFVRPDGSVAMDSGDLTFDLEKPARNFWNYWWYASVPLDVAGTWEIQQDLDGVRFITAPFEVYQPEL